MSTSPRRPMDDEQRDPSEDELRAAYEAELKRLTVGDIVVQTAVSLVNLAGRRMGLVPGGEDERDLEQVRDAIDSVRVLLPILERRSAPELTAIRGALSQLQLAYAREQGAAGPGEQPGAGPQEGPSAQPGAGAQEDAGARQAGGPGGPQEPGERAAEASPAGDGKPGPLPAPGPAESTGRLWVPGR